MSYSYRKDDYVLLRSTMTDDYGNVVEMGCQGRIVHVYSADEFEVKFEDEKINVTLDLEKNKIMPATENAFFKYCVFNAVMGLPATDNTLFKHSILKVLMKFHADERAED